MFRGFNTISLDNKGRMAVPSRYRELISVQSENNLVGQVRRLERAYIVTWPNEARVSVRLRGGHVNVGVVLPGEMTLREKASPIKECAIRTIPG